MEIENTCNLLAIKTSFNVFFQSQKFQLNIFNKKFQLNISIKNFLFSYIKMYLNNVIKRKIFQKS